MDKIRIAVTGIGAASAAGQDTAALAAGLKSAVRPFGPSTRHHVDFDIAVGEAQPNAFAPHEFEDLDSPTGRLCLKAARECVRDAAGRGASPADGLVLGTSTGGQSGNENIIFGLAGGESPPAFSYRGQGCMAAPTRLVARDTMEIIGPVQTISTACTSSAVAIALGATWIASGRGKRVLVGGGDALCYTTIAGFHILDLTGPELCTPFGVNRPGLTLGDGAGFLMLEPMESVSAQGRIPLAELLGFGMSSDAHHMTAPPADGAGAELAIRSALNAAGVAPGQVDHINAHGTGTKLNDAAEATALQRIFGNAIPVMSCKGLLGHTLGGAGAIEAVAAVLSLQEHRAFENIGASEAAEDCPVTLVPRGGLALDERAVILSNSFAFGGNNCALVIGSVAGGLQ